MTGSVFSEVRQYLGYDPTFHDARIVRLHCALERKEIALVVYYSDRPQGPQATHSDGFVHMILSLTFSGILSVDIDFTSNWIDDGTLTLVEGKWLFEWDDQDYGSRSRIVSQDVPTCRVALAQNRFEFEDRSLKEVNFRLVADL